MRQINFKKLPCQSDISVTAILDAISRLYNPEVGIPLNETRFFLSVPNGFDILKFSEDEDLKKYRIHFVICPDGVMHRDAWILYCLDTNDVLLCEGA